MSEKLQQAYLYLQKLFDESEYYQRPENFERKRYRLEHSIRVCKISLKIAEQEHFDDEHKEAIQIACLLHDIGYSIDKLQNENNIKVHGIEGAKLVKKFLKQLGYSGKLLEDMVFGIATHQSGKCDIKGTKTPFSITVANADDIDRFSSYKTVFAFEKNNISKMSHQERLNFILDKIDYFNRHLDSLEYGTETAKKILIDEIDLQLKFYYAMLEQENASYWE